MKESTKISQINVEAKEGERDLSIAVGLSLIKMFVVVSAISFLYQAEVDGIPFLSRWFSLVIVPIATAIAFWGGMHFTLMIMRIVTRFIKVKVRISIIIGYVIALAAICCFVMDRMTKLCAIPETSLGGLTLFTLGSVSLYVLYHFESVMVPLEATLDTLKSDE